MKTYLIRRNVPGAGKLSPAERKNLSVRSCSVIENIGGEKLVWIKSFITSDNLWCVYQAENEELFREHGRQGGFPVDEILEIKAEISPATATAML